MFDDNEYYYSDSTYWRSGVLRPVMMKLIVWQGQDNASNGV